MKTFALPVVDRAQLAWDEVIRRDADKRREFGDECGATDSDVLDVIDEWTTGQCAEGCTPRTPCCDYAVLSALIWRAVAIATQGG